VERIAAGVVQGATKWEPEMQRSMVGAIEDLKLLVRSVRTWGAEQDSRVEESLRRLARYGPEKETRNDDVIVPISQLFFNDDGPHVVYVAPNPKTHYEQQLRETGPIGPGKLSPEVKRMPTPAEARAASEAKTPPRGKELRDVLNSSLATMRSLETRNSGPQPQAPELVPIQELLYKGQRAIERAAEIRRAPLRDRAERRPGVGCRVARARAVARERRDARPRPGQCCRGRWHASPRRRHGRAAAWEVRQQTEATQNASCDHQHR